ncbi:hypothetical protein PL373_16130 [Tenacibaculum maritimum]|nr:hypothetical protein [Tenacibaculum maritimum]MDB0602630.1 hypothetical protein [Tenacibaculum maritimum]MDB0611259.1 hypothetical protein [Tenacibaculum maritimum]
MARLTKEETRRRKEHAKKLYLDPNQKFTIEEMADRVGVTPKTLSKWIDSENWKKLKIGLATSKSQALQDFYEELLAINEVIKSRDKGEKFASFKEAQQRRQLIKDIKAFETETSVAEIYEVGRKFLDYLKPLNPDVFKQVMPFYDAFLRDNIG